MTALPWGGALAAEGLEGGAGRQAAPEAVLDVERIFDHEGVQVMGEVATGRHGRAWNDRARGSQRCPSAPPAPSLEGHPHGLGRHAGDHTFAT